MLDFKGQDILDGAQFTREEVEVVLDVAEDIGSRLEQQRALDILKGYVLGALFFEPSTRTRLSFETAMHRLGGSVVGFASASVSSSAKGESLADTIRTVDQYVDVIAMRHPQIGSAREAAAVAVAPVINGGDGAGQHPTQALLDLFTIRAERGRLDGNTIVLCGDLKYGRTVHAGVELYKHYRCRLILVAPEELKMPPEITGRLRAHGVSVEETADLEAALAKAYVYAVGFCVAFALNPMGALRWLLTGPLAYVVAASAVVSALNTIVITELVRIAVPSSARWTRATYLRLVAVFWTGLFVLLLISAYLMRHR